VLTKRCDSVDPRNPEVIDLIDDLFDTMYAAKGRGLAAPQIGVLQRVCVVDVTWKEGVPNPIAFINPQITQTNKSEMIAQEQCLSIPDLPMGVLRPKSIVLTWETMFGESRTEAFEGNHARCIQHEIDHLNGKVIFDHQDPAQRAILEARYGA